jgi:hypothetical protein
VGVSYIDIEDSLILEDRICTGKFLMLPFGTKTPCAYILPFSMPCVQTKTFVIFKWFSTVQDFIELKFKLSLALLHRVSASYVPWFWFVSDPTVYTAFFACVWITRSSTVVRGHICVCFLLEKPPRGLRYC